MRGRGISRPLILGWESDFSRSKKHLLLDVSFVPAEPGAAEMAPGLPFWAEGGIAGLREEELEKYDLDIVYFCSVHSFASLHWTFHPLLSRTCYVSGIELRCSSNYFSILGRIENSTKK